MDDSFSETMDMLGPAEQAAFQWITSHQKPDASGEPVSGFGPGGIYSLMLPGDDASYRTVIRGGRMAKIPVEGVAAEPEVIRLRAAIIACIAEAGPGLMDLPACLVEYASVLIARNYNVNDDDLTLLLTTDADVQWATPVIHHALGGPSMIRAFAASGSLVQAMLDRHTQITSPAVLPPATPAKVGFFSRLFRCR